MENTIKRFRVYHPGLVCGTSVYAERFTVEDDYINFENGVAMVAAFVIENVTRIMTGPTCEDLAWENPAVLVS